MELQDVISSADLLAPAPSDIHRILVAAQLRVLAEQRADRKIADLVLADPLLVDDLSSEDVPIAAAVVQEARRRQREEGDDRLAPVAWMIVRRVRVPKRVPNRAPLAGYVQALAEWYPDRLRAGERAAAWQAMIELLALDLSALPTVRERLLGFCAEVGLDQPLPDPIERAVLSFAKRRYLFTNARDFLHVMGYQAHHAVQCGDTSVLSRDWLLDWCHYLARPRFGRPYGDRRRRLLRELRDEVHSRIWRLFRPIELLSGERGGISLALIALLIRIDHRLFVATGWSRWQVNRAWFAPLRRVLRWLGEHAASRPPARVATAAPHPSDLEVIATGDVQGGAADTLVTRAQGGLGDVMMMRAGLLELAQRSSGRVFFATNRNLFDVFLRDDPLTLVDIERTVIARYSFGRWIDLTECPAMRIEVGELPHVRTSRLEIFADAMGVPVPAFPRKRRNLTPFDAATERRAIELLGQCATPDKPTVGIQLRAAESYRDAPILIDVARAAAPRYNVVVFDDRPIPRRPDDAFLAISGEPLPVILCLITRLAGLITPDSFALHFAGAHGIPCVGLFGPTDGEVRTRHYPTVRFVDAHAILPCVPCWRHELVKCRVSDSYDSVCMAAISPSAVIAALQDALDNPAR